MNAVAHNNFIRACHGMNAVEIAEQLVMGKLVKQELVAHDLEVPETLTAKMLSLETELKNRSADIRALKMKELQRQIRQLETKVDPGSVLAELKEQLTRLQG